MARVTSDLTGFFAGKKRTSFFELLAQYWSKKPQKKSARPDITDRVIEARLLAQGGVSADEVSL